MYHLVCIRTGIITRKNPVTKEVKEFEGWHLRKGKKYTSDEMCLCEDGQLCYKINQFTGYNLRLAERFREVDEDHEEVLEEELIEVPVGEEDGSLSDDRIVWGA